MLLSFTARMVSHAETYDVVAVASGAILFTTGATLLLLRLVELITGKMLDVLDALVEHNAPKICGVSIAPPLVTP